jgi:hypothetical protein
MMIIPIPIGEPDERFLMHRLKSTSIAGVIGGLVATGLFAYRFYVNDVWSWDLLSVAVTIAAVKLAAMAWYHFTD